MSKAGKIILIIDSAAVFLVVGLTALVFAASLFIDDAGMEQSRIEGTQFGKRTDYEGCQAEGISRIRNMGLIDVTQKRRSTVFCQRLSENEPTEQGFL